MVDRTGLFVAPLPGATPAGTSPTDGRLVLGALFGTSGGCLSGGTLTASASAMQVSVAAAVWRIPDPTNTAGVYLSPADAATLTFSAGPASGSRIDVIYVRQNNYEAGDANSRVIYGVAAGTAASSPTAPAIPAGALKIGQLTVPTGASNAAACALVTSYPAGIAPANITATSKAQLDTITGQFVGQRAHIGEITYRWGGTPAAWQLWEWMQVPLATFGAVANSAVVNTAAAGITELDVAGGIATFNFALYRSAGMGTGTPYFVLSAGFRPAGLVHAGGMIETSGSNYPASIYVDSAGGVFLSGFAGSGPLGLRGTLNYRLAN